MQRYVVSAQRSGLNWLRFCIESFYGRRTPGQTSLIEGQTDETPLFERTHDALNLTSRSRKKARGAWTPLDPEELAADKLLLLLRDPMEIFVRMAERRFPKYLAYVSNIRFYCRAIETERCVVYYEDLVARPATMFEAMRFLDIEPVPGHAVPDAEAVAARWDLLGAASRENYDGKQSRTGGASTKEAPTDFTYHQRNLDPDERDMVWRYLQVRLTKHELALLERYFPEGGLPAPRRSDPLRFWYLDRWQTVLRKKPR